MQRARRLAQRKAALAAGDVPRAAGNGGIPVGGDIVGAAAYCAAVAAGGILGAAGNY